jgi:uncharacterized protein YqgC (DUF456 family)
MGTLLAILGWSLFGIVIVAGLVLDLVGLFGNWLILCAVGVAAVATNFEHFGGWTLPILLGLAIAGEVAELLASGVGAKKFGGSKGAVTAAVVGCIAGAIIGSPIFPIIGTIIGACGGAFLAAALYEFLMQDRSASEAAYTGFGAALGKVAGIFLKAFFGAAMLVVAALAF